MSRGKFDTQEFTGRPAEQLEKAELACRIYMFREVGWTWAFAERLARSTPLVREVALVLVR